MTKNSHASGPTKLQGKHLALGLLALMFGAIGVIFWIGMTGGSTHVPGGPRTIGSQATDENGVALSDYRHTVSTPSPAASAKVDLDAGPIQETIHDRAVRDEVRRRILAAWAQPDEAPSPSGAAPIPTMPQTADGGIDPSYIQSVFRDEFVPMASKCYEDLLTRVDAGGQVTLNFTIMGDAKIGGVVDEVDVSADDAISEPKFKTCIHESMMAVAFRPPPKSGKVTVRYPFNLAP